MEKVKHFVLEGALSVPSLRHEDSSFKHVASWVSCFLGLPLKVWAFTFLTHQDRFCDYLLPAALSACGNESAARYVRGSTRQLYWVPADRSMDSALQIAFVHFGALAKQQFLSQTRGSVARVGVFNHGLPRRYAQGQWLRFRE